MVRLLARMSGRVHNERQRRGQSVFCTTRLGKEEMGGAAVSVRSVSVMLKYVCD